MSPTRRSLSFRTARRIARPNHCREAPDHHRRQL